MLFFHVIFRRLYKHSWVFFLWRLLSFFFTFHLSVSIITQLLFRLFMVTNDPKTSVACNNIYLFLTLGPNPKEEPASLSPAGGTEFWENHAVAHWASLRMWPMPLLFTFHWPNQLTWLSLCQQGMEV